jgi:hypothetical protein
MAFDEGSRLEEIRSQHAASGCFIFPKRGGLMLLWKWGEGKRLPDLAAHPRVEILADTRKIMANADAQPLKFPRRQRMPQCA